MSLRYDASSGHLVHAADGEVTVMLPWPVVKAFHRRHGATAWSLCQPPFALPPAGAEAVQVVRAGEPPLEGFVDLVSFCRRIPASVRQLVSRFPERHWALLSWAARCGPAADELLESNPAMAFAIACGGEISVADDPVNYGRKQFLLAYHSQRDVLARLGFPATERVRRILRKVPAGDVTLPRLLQLRSSLADEAVAERLAHVPVVSAAVIQLLVDGTFGMVTPAALAQIARAQPAGPAAQAPAEAATRRLAEVVACWNLVRPTQPLRPIQRIARLDELHRQIQADVQKAGGRGLETFPPPPFPGDDRIVPITTRAMLVEESRIQHNCANDYASRCAKGTMAFYRVMFPERCTLSLKRAGRGWDIDQLKASCNRLASRGTWQFVRNWLHEAQAERSRSSSGSMAAETPAVMGSRQV
jgi:hypothetical protein